MRIGACAPRGTRRQIASYGATDSLIRVLADTVTMRRLCWPQLLVAIGAGFPCIVLRAHSSDLHIVADCTHPASEQESRPSRGGRTSDSDQRRRSLSWNPLKFANPGTKASWSAKSDR